MRAKTAFLWHSWLGIMGGLLLFVICWTGSFATISHEIDWLLNAQLRVAPASIDSRWRSWQHWQQAVTQHYPHAQLQRLHAPLYAHSAALAVVDFPEQKNVYVYLNPYTAELLGSGSYFNVQRFFRSLHMGLFLPYPLAIYVVGSFGLVLLVTMLTPLLFYKRWWQRFGRWRIWAASSGKSRKIAWSDLHKSSGLCC
jgi:uncharacterized iron-regulated membrane protein